MQALRTTRSQFNPDSAVTPGRWNKYKSPAGGFEELRTGDGLVIRRLFGFISLSFLICTNTTGEVEVPSSQCAQDTMYAQLRTWQGWTNKERSGTASLPPAGPFWRRDHPPRAAGVMVEALTRPSRSLASFRMAAQAVV